LPGYDDLLFPSDQQQPPPSSSPETTQVVEQQAPLGINPALLDYRYQLPLPLPSPLEMFPTPIRRDVRANLGCHDTMSLDGHQHSGYSGFNTVSPHVSASGFANSFVAQDDVDLQVALLRLPWD
jgi:hypothetical protein